MARNGALDALRRHAWFRAREGTIATELARTFGMDPPASLIEDDELRMVFLAAIRRSRATRAWRSA